MTTDLDKWRGTIRRMVLLVSDPNNSFKILLGKYPALYSHRGKSKSFTWQVLLAQLASKYFSLLILLITQRRLIKFSFSSYIFQYYIYCNLVICIILGRGTTTPKPTVNSTVALANFEQGNTKLAVEFLYVSQNLLRKTSSLLNT